MTRTWRGVKVRVSFDARELASTSKAVGEVRAELVVNGRPIEGNVISPELLGTLGGADGTKAIDVSVRWEPVVYGEPKMTMAGATVPTPESRRS